MPSLLSTDVAANYGRMTAQQTYGVGQKFSQFGTRQYRFVKVTATASNGSTAVNFTDASAGALSDFSKAVRALQVVAEINMIFTPGTAGFIAVITEDTAADNDVGTNVPTGYGVLEKAVLDALAKGGLATATVVSVDVDATGVALV